MALPHVYYLLQARTSLEVLCIWSLSAEQQEALQDDWATACGVVLECEGIDGDGCRLWIRCKLVTCHRATTMCLRAPAKCPVCVAGLQRTDNSLFAAVDGQHNDHITNPPYRLGIGMQGLRQGGGSADWPHPGACCGTCLPKHFCCGARGDAWPSNAQLTSCLHLQVPQHAGSTWPVLPHHLRGFRRHSRTYLRTTAARTRRHSSTTAMMRLPVHA
jgi:hypothetical protein